MNQQDIKNTKSMPLIGMPSRMDPGKDCLHLSRQYGDAILSSGGIPIILPLLETPDALRPVIEKLDGILLTGSDSDVDPAQYGVARAPECGPVQSLRDKLDFVLLEIATEKRIPVFGICYGMQSLNVFMGGSLIQDIPSRSETSIQHSRPRTKGHPAHGIRITNSTLADLAGASEAAVNSTHHQALDRVGRSLRVVARAPDGIIEAVMGKDPDHWVFAVQWHPEKSYSLDLLSRRLFDYFVANCGAARRIYEGTHP